MVMFEKSFQQLSNREPVKKVKEGLILQYNNVSLIAYKLTIYENIWRTILIGIVIVGSMAVDRVFKFHNDPLTI